MEDYSSSCFSQFLFDRLISDDSPAVIVFPDDEEIERWQKSIDFFSTRNSFLLPRLKKNPYDRIDPLRFSENQRLKLAARSFLDNAPDLILLSLPSLLERMRRFDSIGEDSIFFAKGDTLNPAQISQRLIDNGYKRVSLVEDPGCFSIRGFVFDVFSPFHDQPVRAELFDDEIESLKFFDTNSQMSGEDCETLIITPAQIYPRLRYENEDFRQELRKKMASQVIPSAAVSKLMANLSEPDSMIAIDRFSPALEFPVASLFEQLVEAGYRFISKDFARFEGLLDELGARVEGRYQKELEKNIEPVFAPLNFYAEKDTFLNGLSEIKVENYSTTRVAENIDGYMLSENTSSKRRDKTYDPHKQLLRQLEEFRNKGLKSFFFCVSPSQKKRFTDLLEHNELKYKKLPQSSIKTMLKVSSSNDLIYLIDHSIEESFFDQSRQIALYSVSDFFPSRGLSSKRRIEIDADFSFLDLEEGAHLVHREHGVGLYRGLVHESVDDSEQDFLKLEYRDGDLLFLPVYRMGLLNLYNGPGDGVKLDRLGGEEFIRKKRKVKEKCLALAASLLEIYAKRELAVASPLAPEKSKFEKFIATFPYSDTEDQLKATMEILADLSKERPMDRLVCGDVGFGKTEVAMRAAFACVASGKQVVVVAPTTVLVQQHERTFRTRFESFPVRVESLSRFKSAKAQKDISDAVKTGEVDILIGTHRVLSQKLKFKEIGLLVVDEEHRFGVKHKERIKKLKADVHVLSLSATPIPRTLQLSLNGIRDLSLMMTAPVERRSVQTKVTLFDYDLIEESISYELSRGGQVYFVHNRVESIGKIAMDIKKLFPDKVVKVGHGQMKEDELSGIMIDFSEGRIDVLVATTIIESGMDIPRANTIIIDRAETFGLAQLYQLRGRVGRSSLIGHAYLLVRPDQKLSPDASRRLEVIERYSELGAGFHIASHDMEIRGAGNIIGDEQHGHQKLVGHDLYLELLNEAIEELRGIKETEIDLDPEINSFLPALIPESYLPQAEQRLMFYGRFSRARKSPELDRVYSQLVNLCGPAPVELRNYYDLMQIRIQMIDHGIVKADIGPLMVKLSFHEKKHSLDGQKLLNWCQKDNKNRMIKPDYSLKYSFQKKQENLSAAQGLIGEIVSQCSLERVEENINV